MIRTNSKIDHRIVNFQAEETDYLEKRHKNATIWQAIFKLATMLAIVFLATLLFTIVN